MLFTEISLDEQLQRALASAGFVTPTPIQAAAIPVALSGRDLVGTAQTGTGKTAAFVLPILQQIITAPLERRRTRAVILAPTRELVEQILAVVLELGCHANIRAAAVYGGIGMRQQVRALRSGADVIIACPGRLLDHMRRGNTDFQVLNFLVLDEADRMLDMGFMPDIQAIIDNLPEKRQTMLFSATFAKTLNNFVRATLREPVRVEVDTAVPAQTVRHAIYKVKSSMKMHVLTGLLRKLAPESESVLIFTRTRETANQVTAHLHAMGMQADVLHAEKTQRERQDTMEQFRYGNFPYLVATDIAARGIDVSCISHVINYDMPANAENYLHRIGRTGRMERTGHAISLVTRGDARTLDEIERMLKKRINAESLAELDIEADQDAMPSPPRRATPRTDRPERPWQEHAPKREDRPHRARPQEPHISAPHRATHHAPRPELHRDHDAPPPAEQLQQEQQQQPRPERPSYQRPVDQPRTADATSGRRSRDRSAYGGKNTAERAPRPERADRPERPERRRQDGDGTEAPKRFERPSGYRETPRENAEARPEHGGSRRFTGRGSVAKHHQKFAATKRKPGEVGGSARLRSSGGPSAASAPRAKRSPGRGR